MNTLKGQRVVFSIPTNGVFRQENIYCDSFRFLGAMASEIAQTGASGSRIVFNFEGGESEEKSIDFLSVGDVYRFKKKIISVTCYGRSTIASFLVFDFFNDSELISDLRERLLYSQYGISGASTSSSGSSIWQKKIITKVRAIYIRDAAALTGDIYPVLQAVISGGNTYLGGALIADGKRLCDIESQVQLPGAGITGFSVLNGVAGDVWSLAVFGY